MPKYLVNISKTIDGRFIVEAEDEHEAYHASLRAENLFDVSDAGWDVIYDVTLLEGDEPKCIPLAEQKEIAKDFLP
jgi:hypothetical protein